jgi:hypothetical protein
MKMSSSSYLMNLAEKIIKETCAAWIGINGLLLIDMQWS